MGSGYNKNQVGAAMPPQKLASSKKTQSWKEQCVQAIANMSNNSYVNGRTSWGRKQVNYDLMNSIMDEDDFKHVLDPYGQGNEQVGNQPAKLHDYNIIANKVNLLKGEEFARPFNWTVMATNGGAVSEKEKKKKELVMFAAQKTLMRELGISDVPMTNPETGEQEPPETLEGVEKYMSSSTADIREQWGNDILKYLQHKENLELKFNEGWEHALIAAEEVFYIGIVNGEPRLRSCNPLNCEFDRNPDNPNTEDGDWFREDRFMTVGQIIDEYGEFLTEGNIKQLDTGDLRQGLTNQMYPGFAYSADDLNRYDRGKGSSKSASNSSQYLVTEVCWKSMKKIGFVTYPNPEEGEAPEEGVVDESFKLTPEMKEMGYSVDWRWIPEVWHGTKIAEDMFVNIEPMANQSRQMDNPSEVKLPYVGRVFNATNSVQTSIVDLLKPYQYLYNVIWFRLEAEIAKAKGKKMVMDIAQIPKSHGIDMDKWMYYFDNVGLALINSFEEGTEGSSTGQVSQFNQFQAVDVSLSQSVAQYINILSKIEQLADKVIGITPQREGGVHQNETVGGVEKSITQSGYVTEPWFYMHNEVKKKALTMLLETAKLAYPDSKKLHYIVDDVQRISAQIDMEKFSDSDYGVFVTNSSKEHATFQKLEALAQQALSTGAAGLSDIVNIYKATSVSELSNLIKDSEARKQQQEQAAQEQAQEMQSQQLEAMAKQEDDKRMHESNENQLDRENDIRKAVINTMGFDTDTADNDVIDVVAQGDLALKQMDSDRKHILERSKQEQERSEKSQDRALKREEMKSKERMNKDNNRTALKNKVTGEK